MHAKLELRYKGHRYTKPDHTLDQVLPDSSSSKPEAHTTVYPDFMRSNSHSSRPRRTLEHRAVGKYSIAPSLSRVGQCARCREIAGLV